jgi:iron complex transport system substrate-binding protein
MRIVSLVPSATEIVYALGLGDQLVGRTHACDYPADVAAVPVVTIEAEPGTPERRLDSRLLTELEPDLVLTDGDEEDRIVAYAEASAAVGAMSDDVTLVALAPLSIEGILNSIATVGAFAEAEDEAVGLVEMLRARLGVLENGILERRLQGIASRRAVVLEGIDPTMTCGRWVPEMARRAGGWELLGREGEPATATTWDRVRDVEPEVIVLAVDGADATAAAAALAAASLPAWFDELEAVRDGELFAVDGGGLFSRPSPRVIDGISVLAELFDPEAFAGSGPSEAWIPLGPLGIGSGRTD